MKLGDSGGSPAAIGQGKGRWLPQNLEHPYMPWAAAGRFHGADPN